MQAVRQLWQRVARIFGPRTRRRIGVVLVALLGSWVGLLAGGSVTEPVGPVDAHLTLRPSLTGNTFVDVAPLGTLELDTTDSPLAINASVAQIRLQAAREILSDPQASLEGIEDRVVKDVRQAVVLLALKSTVFGVLGAAMSTALVFRTWRRVAFGSGATLGALLLSFGVAGVTWNEQAVEQPRYTGVLASAPQLVGSAETIASDFGKYRTQLAKLVTNLTRLYDATAKLPLAEPDPRTIRVLHVSDIHNNPAAWNVIKSVQEQFDATMIIDTGDLTDRGTGPENRIAAGIEDLGVPYVFVKGNHDSKETVQAVARQENAVVLRGEPKTVQGIRLWGIGDPRYQPDELLYTPASDDYLSTYGQQLRPRLEAAGTIDIALTHDPTVSRQWDGLVPLSLAGHMHKRNTEMLPGGTRTMTVGSTGGAGLRAVDNGEPTPIQLDVLYLDRQTHRLQAWDEVTLGGLGLTSAQLDRHTEEEPDRPLNRLAGQSPTPLPTPTPSGTQTPFTVTPSTPPAGPGTGTGQTATGRRRRPPGP